MAGAQGILPLPPPVLSFPRVEAPYACSVPAHPAGCTPHTHLEQASHGPQPTTPASTLTFQIGNEDQNPVTCWRSHSPSAGPGGPVTCTGARAAPILRTILMFSVSEVYDV